MAEIYNLTVEPEQAGMRLDAFLAQQLEGISRSHGVKLIEAGLVTISGQTLDKKHQLKVGDEIDVEVPEPVETEILPEDIPLDIVYEDDQLLVIHKKQGMVVHPGAGNYTGTLVNALMYCCKGKLSGINGVLRPGIVHRIDKDTSGLLVVAKTDTAHAALSAQLQDRSLSREYVAIVNGNIKEDSMQINLPIGRNPSDRKKMCVTTHNAREAITNMQVLERYGKYTLVACKLQTGRTHQIRVHLSHLGHSIVGDPVYGVKKEAFKLNGQLLHARHISFVHPTTGERMGFDAPLPAYFTETLEKIRKQYPMQ